MKLCVQKVLIRANGELQRREIVQSSDVNKREGRMKKILLAVTVFPNQDDKDWPAWVIIAKNGDNMKLTKRPIPDAWKP